MDWVDNMFMELWELSDWETKFQVTYKEWVETGEVVLAQEGECCGMVRGNNFGKNYFVCDRSVWR